MSTPIESTVCPTTHRKVTNGIPWVEKYRPNTLDDVVGNEEAVVRLRAIADGVGDIFSCSMPNLILSGPPGCGKTTCVHALRHE
jgi:replication factor C subunit 2/4